MPAFYNWRGANNIADAWHKCTLFTENKTKQTNNPNKTNPNNNNKPPQNSRIEE